MPVYQVTKTVTTIEEIYAKDENQAKAIIQNESNPTAIVTVNEPIKTKKLDDSLLDALEEGDISFQEFLETAHNTHATKGQKEQLIELLEYNISDYNNADDCIHVYTSISSHPEKQGQKDITILRINRPTSMAQNLQTPTLTSPTRRPSRLSIERYCNL